MYKIKAPDEKYDRKIGGVQFVNGEALTENGWLASWFSGREGFTVEEVKPKKERKHDKGNADPADEAAAADGAGGNA